MMRMIGIGVVAIGLVLGVLYIVGVGMTARVETIDWRDLTPAPGANFITTRTGRIHYVDVGAGPAILLMHGSGRSIADWQEGTIERLSAHHRVIAFDYFGNGSSERNAAFTYGYDLWVNEAVELLAALAVPHATVIGHSVGGALACVLAADHPALVDHVVTIGTGMTIEPQQFLPLIPGLGEVLMANVRTFGGTYSDKHRLALEAAYRVKGTRAAVLSYIRRQMTVDGLRLLRGTFEDVRVPVLHLSGTRDINIAPAIARDLAKRTHGTFVSIEGATHMVQIDAPGRLVEEVEKFLAEPSVKAAPAT
ncbi:MAG: alpha/beta hydrolase [Deltaproteobacteria bacterium]|nr:alpha/beta hydrolase [Deltaproteobacteria bacterium]